MSPRLRAAHPAPLALALAGCAGLQHAPAPQESKEAAGSAASSGGVHFTPLASGPDDPLRIADQAPAYPAFDARRPAPILEAGDPFLGTGPLNPGLELATGQVLQPQFLLHGTLRTAGQVFDGGSTTFGELASRLDLRGDLRLSGTERLVAAFRPIDNDRGDFTGYAFAPEDDAGFEGELNEAPTALFFEGEFGELFPGLDDGDRLPLDWGVSVGRQNLVIQDGLLVDDIVDMLGVTRNSLTAAGASNLRWTGYYGWNEVNLGDNQVDDRASLIGLSGAADTHERTVSLDVIYRHDERDLNNAWFFGAGSTQRLGALNSTVRVAASLPTHERADRTGSGALLFSELSKTLERSDDLVYGNAFVSLSDFSSASRGDDRGGPVGRTGLLFEPVGLGRYGQALDSDLDDVFGGALGLQSYLGGVREQLILEVGGTAGFSGREADALAIGARYQRAVGAHGILRVDGFTRAQEGRAPGYGLRVEWTLEF